jgi:hypothetical protein
MYITAGCLKKDVRSASEPCPLTTAWIAASTYQDHVSELAEVEASASVLPFNLKIPFRRCSELRWRDFDLPGS